MQYCFNPERIHNGKYGCRMWKVKILSVQAIERTNTLTETSYDKESTSISTRWYEQRQFQSSMKSGIIESKKQVHIYETLNKEQISIDIAHPKKTV